MTVGMTRRASKPEKKPGEKRPKGRSRIGFKEDRNAWREKNAKKRYRGQDNRRNK